MRLMGADTPGGGHPDAREAAKPLAAAEGRHEEKKAEEQKEEPKINMGKRAVLRLMGP